MTHPSQYFLGADIGGTKTHVLIADETGRAVGFGEAGPGNPEMVGYDGMAAILRTAGEQALSYLGGSFDLIAGAGFGIAGFDWPSQRADTLGAIRSLGFTCPIEIVNDALPGVLAGSADGWGVAVVSGTGCNCWGWDRTRQRVGRVTGGGIDMGEGAGASELTFEAVRAVARAWTKRSPATALTDAFIAHTGAINHADLLEGLMGGRYDIRSSAAPLIFRVAAGGDPVAVELIRWAGRELGELANAVIRQLEFEALAFDVVLLGSMFDGSLQLIETMRQAIHTVAPQARLVRLTVPPVVGAVLLGMEQAGVQPTPEIRQNLTASAREARNNHNNH